MDFCLLVYESLYVVIIFCWWEGIFVLYLFLYCLSVYNCRRSHETEQWLHLISCTNVCAGSGGFILLASCLIRLGPISLNACHNAVMSHLRFLICQSYLSWGAPIFLIGFNLLCCADLLITCDSQWLWYESLHIVLNTCHRLLGGGTMIKFARFTKDAPSF